jgi:hypothetical protein
VEHEVKRDFFRDAEGDRKKVFAYAEELRRVQINHKRYPHNASQAGKASEAMKKEKDCYHS